MAEHDLHTIGTATFEEVSMIPRNILLRNQAVALGDIRYTSKLKSNLFLECTQAGTTGATMPSFVSVQEGDTVTDGTAIWKVVRSITSSDTIDSGVKVADVANVGYEMATGQVSITWTDPDDVVYQGASLARWAGTKLVRKIGSAPANEDDGTVVVDSTVKNAYSTTAYVDSGLVDGTTYYYRLFPYTDVGSVTAGTSFSAAPNKHLTTMTVTKDMDAYAVQAGDTVEVATITTDGDGLLVATSSDETIGIASVSNGKVVVEPVSEGTITVTVRQLAGLEWSSAGPETISVTVVFVSADLNNETPETIQYVAQHDLADSLWDIGDYFEMTLNGSWQCTDNIITLNNYVIRCVLIGINHNADKEGNHMLHFQMGKNTDNVDVAFYSSKMNVATNNSGGWESCKMRTITMANLYNTIIPSNWRAVIKPCTKYTDNLGGRTDRDSNVTATSDNCFLLAAYEVFGLCIHSRRAEPQYQQQYAYYANGNSKVRYRHDLPTDSAEWWTRSVGTNSDASFCAVDPLGTSSTTGAYGINSISPAFCIG